MRDQIQKQMWLNEAVRYRFGLHLKAIEIMPNGRVYFVFRVGQLEPSRAAPFPPNTPEEARRFADRLFDTHESELVFLGIK